MGTPVAAQFKERGCFFGRSIFGSLWSTSFDHFDCSIQRVWVKEVLPPIVDMLLDVIQKFWEVSENLLNDRLWSYLNMIQIAMICWRSASCSDHSLDWKIPHHSYDCRIENLPCMRRNKDIESSALVLNKDLGLPYCTDNWRYLRLLFNAIGIRCIDFSWYKSKVKAI